MKKNLTRLLSLMLIATTMLASCKPAPHEHSFDTEWETSDTHHWHAATCEHGEIKDSEAEHTDANEDGNCDVCGFERGHTHTYEKEWSYDETHHWYKATCSHTDEKGSNALHIDENKDGACDVCTGHVHNINPAGYCTIPGCGKQTGSVDETKLDELVNAVYFQNYLVNGGTVDYNFVGKSNHDPSFNATRHEEVEYKFGKDDYTWTKVTSHATNGANSADSTLETWHQLKNAEETFGVYSENGESPTLDINNVDRLKGYFISLSTLSSEYGTAETLYALYLAAADQNEDGNLLGDVDIEISEEDRKVTFKYEYKTVFVNHTDVTDVETGDKAEVYNVNYFIVDVSFCYDDSFVLTELWISCDCYTNDAGALPDGSPNEADIDLDYDPATGEFTLRENAIADNYTVYCTQQAGERTEENPNPQSKFVPTSFNMYLTKELILDEKGNDIDYVLKNKVDGRITAKLYDIVTLYISDYTPESASLHFIAEQVSFKLFLKEMYKEEYEVFDPTNPDNTTACCDFTYAGELRNFFLIPKVDGVYRLEIYVMGEKMAEATVNAGLVESGEVEHDPSKEFVATVFEAFEWTNELSFTATKSGTYYFYLPVGFGLVNADEQDAADKTPDTGDGPVPYYDFQDMDNRNPDGSYKAGTVRIVLTEGETIRFYANASQRGNFVIRFVCFG